LNERAVANAYDYIDFPIQSSTETESDFRKFACMHRLCADVRSCLGFTMMLDRTSALSKRFWFHCCDQDKDGFLSREDLEYIYKQQIFKMQSNLFEVVTFSQLALDLYDCYQLYFFHAKILVLPWPNQRRANWI
jgi:hypothetical protein